MAISDEHPPEDPLYANKNYFGLFILVEFCIASIKF